MMWCLLVKFLKGEVLQYFRATTVHGFSYVGNPTNHAAVKAFWASLMAKKFKHLREKDWSFCV